MAKHLLNLLAVFTVLLCLTFMLIVKKVEKERVEFLITVTWPEDSANDAEENVPSLPVTPDCTESVIHIDENSDGFDDNTGEYISVP